MVLGSQIRLGMTDEGKINSLLHFMSHPYQNFFSKNFYHRIFNNICNAGFTMYIQRATENAQMSPSIEKSILVIDQWGLETRA